MASRARSWASSKLRWLWFVGAGVFIVACLAVVRAPKPARVDPLQPRADQQPTAFSVVYWGPREQAATNAVITLVFSRPIVELTASGALPDGFPTPSLEPPVAGQWIAVGSSALQFHPEQTRLPAATHFTVQLERIEALDGEALAAPHRFEFTTPLPRVVHHDPPADASGLALETHVRLRFNQPVLLESVERAASLRADGEPVAFEVHAVAPEPNAATPRTPEPAPAQPLARDAAIELLLRPARPLPRDATIDLLLAPGVRARQGPLASVDPFRLRFSTYGPLRAQLRCGWGECTPAAPLVLSFSNPVRFADVKRHFSCAPPLDLEWSSWFDEDDFVNEAMANAALRPRQRYRCQLAPGLRDQYGQLDATRAPLQFVTQDYPPDLRVGVEGTYLDPRAARSLTLRSRNVTGYRLSTAVAPPEYVAQLSWAPWDAPNVSALPGATQAWFAGGALNSLHDVKLDLPTLFAQLGAPTANGPLALQVSFAGPDGEAQQRRQLLQVSDLALSAKLGRNGSLLWVTRLSSGAPQPGASVELWEGPERRLARTTDSTGVVRLTADEYTPELAPREARRTFVVRHGEQTLMAAETSHLGSWRMPIPPDPSSQRYRTHLFTDRGIYRPGSEIWVKGIVRRSDAVGARAVVDGLPLSVSLVAPDGSETSTQQLRTNRFGSVALQLRVPESAALGHWQVKASGESLAESTLLRVAEYEPAEFTVRAHGDAPSYFDGASARWTTSAEYLFGAPLAGGKLRYHVSHQATSFTPSQSDGWVTDDDAYRADIESHAPSGGVLASGEATLDAQGRHTLKLPLEVAGAPQPRLVRFDAEVSDVSRRAIAASASAILHPADYYVGIEPLEHSVISAPHQLTPRVLALDPAGGRVAGREVQLELVRRRWTNVRQQSGAAQRQLRQRIDETVDRCTVRTGPTPRACSLDVTEAGYYLVRATSSDAQQRQTNSSLALYALGEGRISWRDDAASQHVQLTADKPRYRIGERARLLVQSPFSSANALVTVERAGVLEHRFVTLRGPSPSFELPITAAFAPNVYVAVHLIRPNVAGGKLAEPELYRVGYLQLEVDSSSRELRVELSPKQRELAPGQRAEVDVAVHDARGAPVPAEVTLFAVDEGALQATDYQLPDPSQVFTSPRPLGVVTLESRADLARLLAPDELSFHDKGAEGGGGGGARANFAQTAHFEPGLVTDAAGRARATFQLPDSLTSYRLMAVALSADDRYGSAVDRLTTSKPLMARPALPRFLRAGDRFEAVVAVSTRDFAASEVEVELEATGVELAGPRVARLDVAATATREVRFSATAGEAGSATFRFTVRSLSSPHTDRVELVRRIHSPASLETVAAYGEVTSAEGQRLGALDRVRPDVGGLDVALSSTRLVGLDASIEALVDYPYACTEQLASRLLPLLPLRELARAFGRERAVPAMPQRVVGQLLESQQGSGGFGFWSGSPAPDPWISAYALWVLRLAHADGLTVGETVWERGANYLERALSRLAQRAATASTPAQAQVDRDLQAFIAFVLAELDRAQPATIERLLESASAASVDGLAWLALAAAASRAPDDVLEPLQARLEARVVQDGNRATVQAQPNATQRARLLTSRTRSQALVLYALLSLNPRHPLASGLANDLLRRRVDGVWRNTQESAFSLLALNAYWKAREQQAPSVTAQVWLGDQPLVSERFEGRSSVARVHHFDMRRLLQAGSLDLVVEATQRQTQAPVFYEVRLNYAARELPAQPLDRGLSVLKLVRTVPASELSRAVQQSPLVALGDPRGSAATAAPLRAESTASLPTQVLPADHLVLVDLLVATSVTRRHVVVDDPLPAGLEAVDFSLATTSADLADAVTEAPALSGFATTWSQQELRDDRVLHFTEELAPGLYRFQYLARPTTLGQFVVPPTRAFEMYQPEVSGRTGASLAVIQPASAVAP